MGQGDLSHAGIHLDGLEGGDVRICVWVPGFVKSATPYRGYAIWPSNSLDKTATPFLILDRGVEFWRSKSWIFECMQRNCYFFQNLTNVSRKINTFPWKSMDSQACTPIEDPGSAIWPSNSLDKTATPFRILDRGVDFWSPNGRIFECMQRNHNFFKELTNAYKKSMTPIQDSWSDPQILSTKRPLHFWSLIGVSISEAPKT